MVRMKRTPSKGKAVYSNRFKIGPKSFYIRPKLMRTIRKLQLSTELLIAKAPFARVIREVMQDVGVKIHGQRSERDQLRVQTLALKALQEAAEMYLVSLFEDSNLAAGHAGRVTVRVQDMKFVLSLRGRSDVYNH